MGRMEAEPKGAELIRGTSARCEKVFAVKEKGKNGER
jgi:hypothetical protein